MVDFILALIFLVARFYGHVEPDPASTETGSFRLCHIRTRIISFEKFSIFSLTSHEKQNFRSITNLFP